MMMQRQKMRFIGHGGSKRLWILEKRVIVGRLSGHLHGKGLWRLRCQIWMRMLYSVRENGMRSMAWMVGWMVPLTLVSLVSGQLEGCSRIVCYELLDTVGCK